MAQTNNQDKGKIVAEFEAMRSFELSARDLYQEIANDSRITQAKIRDAFVKLAEDEHYHAGLVQEILDLIHVAL